MALTGVLFVLQMDKNFLAKLAVSKPDEQVQSFGPATLEWPVATIEVDASDRTQIKDRVVFP